MFTGSGHDQLTNELDDLFTDWVRVQTSNKTLEKNGSLDERDFMFLLLIAAHNLEQK